MERKKEKKRIIKVDKDRFTESVYHVVIYGNTIRCFNDLLVGVGGKINEHERVIIRYSIQWNVMLMTISLMDELNKYLFKYNPIDNETKDRIDSYKNIIEPILVEIDKWADMRKFRNNVLAHNFRIDSDNFKSVHLNNSLKNYNIPEHMVDFATLLKYLDSITRIAEEIFKKEYDAALKIVDSFKNIPKQSNQSFKNEAAKVNSILVEVNDRINEYNLKLSRE